MVFMVGLTSRVKASVYIRLDMIGFFSEFFPWICLGCLEYVPNGGEKIRGLAWDRIRKNSP